MADTKRDEEWEAAMANQSTVDTQPSVHALAQAARTALRETAESLTPTDETCRRAWGRIESGAREKGLLAPRAKSSWLSLLGIPNIAAPAFALSLAAAIGLAWWMMRTPEPDMMVIALRGEPQRIPVPDADTESPQLVLELRALGLTSEVHRESEGIRVDIVWPAAPSRDLEDWRTRKGFTVAPDGKLHLLLVKPVP